MSRFLRALMLHTALITLVVVAGFMCGVLVAWLWPIGARAGPP